MSTPFYKLSPGGIDTVGLGLRSPAGVVFPLTGGDEADLDVTSQAGAMHLTPTGPFVLIGGAPQAMMVAGQSFDLGAGVLSVDQIDESTAGAGVLVDGLKLKDSGIDATGLLTGVGYLALTDNLASAWVFKEAANAYLTFVTTNSSESVAVGQRLTTTDGVASGTAKVVGGRLSASVADSSAIAQAVAGYSSFDVTASIPANTLKSGSILKIRAVVRVTVALNGGATATGKLRIGGTDVVTSGACTTGAANDRLVIDVVLTARAAPGAAVAIAGVGTAAWSDTPAVITVSEPSGVPTFATNGALAVDVQVSTSAAGDASGRLVLEQLYVEVI